MFWCFRCVRNLIGAIVALAGLLALTEVGLRVHRLTQPLEAASDSTVCPLIGPSAVTGWELQPAARKSVLTDRGETIALRTNSLGLRGDELATPKPVGVYRIVVLGDEALIAPTIVEESTMPQRIGLRLQSLSPAARVEVLNAGLPHAAPVTAAILYRQRLLALQPDVVILHVHPGDVAQDQAVRKWVIQDAKGHGLVCTHPERGSSLKTLPVADLRREFAVVDRLWGELGPLCQSESTRKSPPVRMTRGLVGEMLSPIETLAALCQSTNATLVVCVAPTTEAERSAKVDGDVTFAATTFAWVSQRHIPVVDGAGALTASEDFLTVSPGWSVAGHSRLADFLATQLVQNLRGPWSAPYAAPTALPASYQRSE